MLVWFKSNIDKNTSVRVEFPNLTSNRKLNSQYLVHIYNLFYVKTFCYLKLCSIYEKNYIQNSLIIQINRNYFYFLDN